jgi:hypothetical protein
VVETQDDTAGAAAENIADPEQIAAATKIQATFRGHQARKSVKAEGDGSSASMEEATQETEITVAETKAARQLASNVDQADLVTGKVAVPVLKDPRGVPPTATQLPAGWEQRAAADGTLYFVDHVTKSTSWDDPRLVKLENTAILRLRATLRIQKWFRKQQAKMRTDVRYVAHTAYVGRSDTEISFDKGAQLDAKRMDKHWLRGAVVGSDRSGFIPASYVIAL